MLLGLGTAMGTSQDMLGAPACRQASGETVSPFRAEQGTSLETPSRARVQDLMKGVQYCF